MSPRRWSPSLAQAGILTPFPIQAATLPDALAGLDILGRGRTGSGKTLGFSIPLVAGLADGHTLACRPRGLVLVPTRELASQVHAVLAPLAAAMNLTVATIFGGIGQNPQVTALRNRVDIVVACPGRLADLIEQGHCHLGDVEISVLDEADHMADLGFLPVVRRLMEATPPEGQRMLFSATLDKAVNVLVRRFLTDPAVHSVDSAAAAPAAMVHHLLTAAPGGPGARGRRAGGRRQPVAGLHPHQARRAEARPAARRGGVPAAELHGNLRQGARERNLASFASGAARVLVATDIAARGIHVDGIDLVIHADPPTEHKAYLHRSGRTARAGAAGVVITVQSPAQAGDVRVPDAPGRRGPADGQRQPRLGAAAFHRRPAGRPGGPGRAARGPRSAGDGGARHRQRRGRHVRRIPGTPQALTMTRPPPRGPGYREGRGDGNTRPRQDALLR